MASPQLENGHTRIANEILEHLSMPGLSGSEYRLIFVVIRKTYGFQKKQDKISLSQFQKYSGMKRVNVVRTLKSLVAKQLLAKEKNLYIFNKNWESWVVAKRLPLVAKQLLPSSQTATKSSSQLATHKRKKETNTKEKIHASPSATPFVWNEYLGRMDNHKERRIQIIAFFFKEKRLVFDTLGKAQTAIRRHLRAAKELEPFSDSEITKAVAQAQHEFPGMWTIETLVKLLTK